MNFKKRLKVLEKTISTDLYRVIYKNGTTKVIGGMQLLKFSINTSREETADKVEKIESMQDEKDATYLKLCRAIMEC